jgi:isocitrate dehydrogenase
MADAKIIWTEVDEAPALASYALLPVIKSFTKGCDIDVEVSDISLAGRIHRPVSGAPAAGTAGCRSLK